MGRAQLLLSFKAQQDELTMEMVLWRLPETSPERPHGLKYRLYLGRDGRTLVRYDNEAGKGDHRHVGVDEREEAYAFADVERLLEDFLSECETLGWRLSDETNLRRSDDD